MMSETKITHGQLDQQQNQHALEILASRSTRKGWRRITPFLGAAFDVHCQ